MDAGTGARVRPELQHGQDFRRKNIPASGQGPGDLVATGLGRQRSGLGEGTNRARDDTDRPSTDNVFRCRARSCSALSVTNYDRAIRETNEAIRDLE